MQILHFYQNFLGGGGVANGVLGLVNAQKQLGHEVLLVVMEMQRAPLYEPMMPLLDCELLTWRPGMTFTLGGLEIAVPDRRLMEEINRWQPDIVHIHGEFLPVNIWLRRALKFPMILTPHGAFHPGLFKSGTRVRRLRRHLYVRFAKPLLYRRLLALHAVSPVEEHHIRRMVPGAMVYSLPAMMPPGTQTLLRASENGTRKASGEVKVLFVGRLDVYCKGLDILLQAFAQAIQRFPSNKISLFMVGPDWRQGLSTLQDTVRELGIAGRVKFTGSVAREGVAELLSQADLFVLLSRHDGCPLSLAEALMKGIPSIASTEVGLVGYPEIASLPYLCTVRPEIAEAASAIANCIARREELHRLGRQHAQQVKDFYDGSRIANLHIERYRELLGHRASADFKVPAESQTVVGL